MAQKLQKQSCVIYKKLKEEDLDFYFCSFFQIHAGTSFSWYPGISHLTDDNNDTFFIKDDSVSLQYISCNQEKPQL